MAKQKCKEREKRARDAEDIELKYCNSLKSDLTSTDTPATTTDTTSTISSSETSTFSTSTSTPTTPAPFNHSEFVYGHYCTCDITRDACDVNCCCDVDCNEVDVKVFSGCLRAETYDPDPRLVCLT